MKVSLENSESPMDYTMETVMPGVKQRLDSNENAIRELSRQVQKTPQEVQEKLLPAFSNLLKEMLLGAAKGAADAMGGGNLDGRQSPLGVSLGVSRTTTRDNEPSSPPTHFLVDKHESVQGYYDEWFGKGDFDGIPIAGGVEALELKWKRRWRGGKKQDQRISRQKRLVDAIKKRAQSTGETIEQVCESWNLLFVSNNRNLQRLILELQKTENGGFVKKTKNRGRLNN